MEKLLHYVWKHKLFPLKQLMTTDGREVEVIDAGLHNKNSGPDFFNAKVKIGGTLWVGNVELHIKSSDWYAHGHQHDAAYNNVVLHVCQEADADVRTHSGNLLPQLVLTIPQHVTEHYEELLRTDHFPPCYQIIPSLSPLKVHAWLSALQTERLEQKTVAINKRVEQLGGDWEAACFVTLARNYGFGINGDAFETWAMNMPLGAAAHHRDNLFQIEALFLGQAGLLDERFIPSYYHDEALREGYFTKLHNEYLFLAHKFSLKPVDATLWRFLRLRPQNFPHIRIVQLANLYCSRRFSLSQLLDCQTIDDLCKMLATSVTPYWETHYTFGSTSAPVAKHLSEASLRLLIINTVVPMLFSYGRYRMNERWCDRAFDFLEKLGAESNHITRMWRQCGLEVKSASDSQALIQLKKEYCDRRDCLRCRFGYEYLKGEG